MPSPRTPRHRRRSSVGASVKLTELRKLLGWSVSTFDQWMAEHDIRLRRYRQAQFLRWIDIAPHLTREERVRVRRLSTKAVEPGGSKYWVSGYPHLVAQWDRDRNFDIEPWEVTYASGKRIWWRCPKGPDHIWGAQPANRTLQNTGCPACKNKQVSVTNSLATLHLDVAQQWHYEKNGKLNPSAVVAGCKKRVWWKCPKGPDHDWCAAICHRSLRGNGCPFCTGQRVSVTNCLAAVRPELARQWHGSRNASLTPRDVTAGSTKKVWWTCPKGPDHQWQAAVADRSAGKGCPACSGYQVSVTNSLATLFPGVAAQWHPRRNGSKTPEDVTSGTRQCAWWKCSKSAGHVWRSSIVNRTAQDSGCPFCSGHRVSSRNRLSTRAPVVAAEWHSTKNGMLRPSEVSYASSHVVWWRCSKHPHHEWRTSVNNRTGKEATGCPYCSNKKVDAKKSVAALYPDVAAQWDATKNGDLTSRDVVPGSSSVRVWWKCPKGPDHEWHQNPRERCLNGSGCPFCRGARVSVTNSVATVAPHVAAQWHPSRNGSLTPADVTWGTDRRVWWRCPKNPKHIWQASVVNRVSRGQGCPACAGKRPSHLRNAITHKTREKRRVSSA